MFQIDTEFPRKTDPSKRNGFFRIINGFFQIINKQENSTDYSSINRERWYSLKRFSVGR